MLGRMLLMTVALTMALPAGAAALGAGVLFDPVSREAFARLGLAGLLMGLSEWADGVPPDIAAAALVAVGRALGLVLVLPPVLTAVIGEVLGLRGAFWYGGACAGLTAALPWLVRGAARPPADSAAAAAEARFTVILLLTGVASGLVYGLIAGRHDRP